MSIIAFPENRKLKSEPRAPLQEEDWEFQARGPIPEPKD
jgi:hypothetical protein